MADNQFLNVPLSIPDHGQHLRLISSALNNTIDGKLNSTGTFTTIGTKTLETVIDARCGGNSVVLWSPLTVDAAGEMTHMWLAATRNGEFDIGHRNHSKNVQCKYVIIG
jgi:hypothetical protein